MQKMTWEQCYQRIVEKHGLYYDYDLDTFYSANKKMRIKCPTHGWFEQVVADHYRGCGCGKCGSKSAGDKLRKHAADFIKEAKSVHGNTYDYSKVEYVNGNTKVVVTCSKHGDFLVVPSVHLNGHHCLKCAVDFRQHGIGFYNSKFFDKYPDLASPDKFGLVYLIRLPEINRVKLGMTRVDDWNIRFNRIRASVGVVEEVNLFRTNAKHAFETESKLHRKYQRHRLPSEVDFSGRTECYPLSLESTLMWEISDLIAEREEKKV